MQIRSLPLPLVGGAYVISHLLLDALSYVHPFGAFGITPWNPSTGLGFLFVLLYGWRALPFYLAALILANIVVRGLPVPLGIAFAEAAIRGGIYGYALLLLLRPGVRFDRSLSSVRDLFLLLIVALSSSATVAFLYVALLITTGLLLPQDLTQALLRCMVGDMIGIAVVTPFGLLALARWHLVKVDWEGVLQMVSSVALTMCVAVVYAETDQLQLFYLLFLPLTWIAVRSGIEGVSAALLLIQVGLFFALLLFASRNVDVLDFQARMLVLAVTGLVAGVLVTERRLAEAQLRMNQHALAQLSRLGSMGELAAAIAHEINQPLSAASTYTNIVAESLQDEKLEDHSIGEMAGKAAAQINRAADVVRRLRTLVRMGRSDLSATSISVIVQEASDIARPDLERQKITLKIDLDSNLPLVMADRLQIEQVLLNLIRNSAEAITGEAVAQGHITILARRKPPFVELGVHDTGPGFGAGFSFGLPAPLSTTKAEGLGIGLSLCRSIAEAHGGTLSIDSTPDGASVAIMLPIAKDGYHAG
jgi:two-component system, LuxR family, sensor kinase FixL